MFNTLSNKGNATLRVHLTPVRMAVMKKTNNRLDTVVHICSPSNLGGRNR
jgi:hypothetical protein